MKKVIHTFKTNFLIVNEQFTDRNWKELNVSIVEMDNTVQFETVYPDYIYNEAKKISPELYDQEYLDIQKKEHEERYGTVNNMSRTKAKSKTIRFPYLQGLKEELSDISVKIETIHNFKDDYGEKVIFIKFHGHVNDPRSYSGGGMGLVNVINFQYFIGYRFIGFGKKNLLDDKERKLEKYTSQYKLGRFEGKGDGSSTDGREHTIVSLHQTDKDMENLKREFVIIPWTEEREDYLKKIQDNFTTLTNKLNDFLKDLTEEKLDHLIENQPIQKLLSN